MDEIRKVCPKLSYNRPEIIGCYLDQCPFYNEKYGCIDAYEILMNIEQWENEKILFEKTKKELKAQGDISIH